MENRMMGCARGRIIPYFSAALLTLSIVWTVAVYGFGLCYHRFRPAEEPFPEEWFEDIANIDWNQVYHGEPLFWVQPALLHPVFLMEDTLNAGVTFYTEPNTDSPVIRRIEAGENPGNYGWVMTDSLPCSQPGWRAMRAIGWTGYFKESDWRNLFPRPKGSIGRRWDYYNFYADVVLWESGRYRVPNYLFNRPANIATAVLWTVTVAFCVITFFVRKRIRWNRKTCIKLALTGFTVVLAFLGLLALRPKPELVPQKENESRASWVLHNLYGDSRRYPHEYYDDLTYARAK